MIHPVSSARVLLAIHLGFLLQTANANVVLDWNAVMMAAIRLDNTGPTLSTRNLAILHLAIFDSVNAIVRDHQAYQFQPATDPETSIEAAVAAAGYEVVRALYPSIRARADDTFETWLAAAPRDAALTNGMLLGTKVGQLTLSARADDGASTEVPYIPSNAPGQWRRTPPFFRPPLTPHWRYVRLFALPSLEPFLPGPPPALDSPEYAEALNEVKRIGAKNSTVRTPEQTQIAVFWSDFSYTAMPPGHWHEIAATIVRTQNTDLVATARLMALLSLAQADSATLCWEVKFRYNLWRPVTAIQRADEDDNPDTEFDRTWDHLLPSPPFPSYTSGHSTFSKASADVLTYFYGTDALTFTAASDSLPGVFRTFQSLSACADEVGMSRIYGGFHFQFDNRAGKRTGASVAGHVASNYLLSNQRLPLVRMESYRGENVQVRVHGHLGQSVVLEASTDLSQWQPVSTSLAVAGGVLAQVPGQAAGHQFFRAREPE